MLKIHLTAVMLNCLPLVVMLA